MEDVNIDGGMVCSMPGKRKKRCMMEKKPKKLSRPSKRGAKSMRKGEPLKGQVDIGHYFFKLKDNSMELSENPMGVGGMVGEDT